MKRFRGQEQPIKGSILAGKNLGIQHSSGKFLHLKERDDFFEVGNGSRDDRYGVLNRSSSYKSPMVMEFDGHINLLDGKNDFSLWRVKMRALLIQNGLFNALKGKSKLPAMMTEEDKEDYLNRALSLIQLTLSDKVLQEVMDETTPDGLWKRLEKIYLDKSSTNRFLLKLKLYGLRMKEGTSLEDHLNEFNKIISDLRDIEVKIEDEDQATLLLCSLPPSYEQFTNAMVVGRTSISVEDVKLCLRLEELRNKSRVGQGDTSVGNEDGDETKSKSYSKRKGTCSKCGEKGHFRRNCPNL